MSKLYYTPPLQSVFNEVKEKAIGIWSAYDNTYGYVDEKLSKLRGLGNIGDNFMFMVAMFDSENQRKLAHKLSPEAKEAISERIKDGGMPDFYNEFL
jgi:hypothetical protein